MSEKISRIGRPPAPWVYKILKLNLAGPYWIDAYELAQLLGVSANSVKVFVHRFEIDRRYEKENSVVKSKFQISVLKKRVQAYISQWPESITKPHLL